MTSVEGFVPLNQPKRFPYIREKRITEPTFVCVSQYIIQSLVSFKVGFQSCLLFVLPLHTCKILIHNRKRK